MKLKPIMLFTTATVLLFLCGIFTNHKAIDIQLHDTYYIIGYLYIAIFLGTLTGLTTLIYYGLERVKRPIKSKTGFWHFGFFMTGLLSLIVTINLPTPTYSYDTNIYGLIALMFMGIILFLMSIIVFLYGTTKSLFNKQQ